MRIAHLILAHKGPAQLARLLRTLHHPDADCFVHLDAKAPFADFAFLGKLPRVFFTRTRLNVKWGGYSLTRVVLEGCREILAAAPHYDVLNVLSAQDYPLQPAAVVHQFFERHPGQSFLECAPAGSAWWQANRSRIERYHLTEYAFPGKHRVQQVLNRLLPRRRFPLPYTLYGGNMGGWYTLSRACAEYLLAFLDQRPRVGRFARFTWGSDEFLIHTILLNSPHKASIHHDNNLRYIDWSGGGASPRTLGSPDLARVLAAPKFWARKFDMEQDPGMLDALDCARHLVPAGVQA